VVDSLGPRPLDLYLVGSRADGRAGDTGDWDFVALTPDDANTNLSLYPLGRAADRSDQVDLDVLGPALRMRRETRDLPIWTWQLSRARLVHTGWGGGEGYRADLADRFARSASTLAIDCWARFRLHRNSALSTLAKGEPLAIALCLPLFAHAAIRAVLLWEGRPYPPDKWLAADAPAWTRPSLEALLGTAVFETQRAAVDELSRLVEERVPVDELGDWYQLI
jgi:hypothetical protein